jgi:hypothetical protein
MIGGLVIIDSSRMIGSKFFQRISDQMGKRWVIFFFDPSYSYILKPGGHFGKFYDD